MRSAVLVCLQELRILLTDRQALALLFLMPMALIVFLILALKNVYLAKVGVDQKIILVSREGCENEELCSELKTELEGFGYQVTTTQELPKSTEQMALVLPKDLNQTLEQLQKSQPLELDQQLKLLFDPTLDRSLRELTKSHLALSLQGILIRQVHKEAAKADLPLKLPDVTRFQDLVSEQSFGLAILPNPIQQSVPAWALFGMFFIVIPLTNSMIRDRQSGVFKRLMSFSLSKSSLLLGKTLPFFVINIIQFIVMFALGYGLLPQWLGVPVDANFNFFALAVVTLATALAATSYGLLVSCLTRSPEQAHSLGALSVVILAVIGGVMIPKLVMPEFMQNIAMISPLYWGLEAYLDVTVRKVAFLDVGGKISVLLAFSLAALLVAKSRFRWSES